MTGECHFCHGIVSGLENDHIVLRDHGDHDVYMHEECALGHNVLESTAASSEHVAITCPVCGTVERRGRPDSGQST